MELPLILERTTQGFLSFCLVVVGFFFLEIMEQLNSQQPTMKIGCGYLQSFALYIQNSLQKCTK